jgi:O-antigen ligase
LIRSAAELEAPPAVVAAAAPAERSASPAAITLLHGALFLAILVSPLVFIEPSPYEAACGLLAVACIAARVPLDRKLLPLLVLLLVFNVGGIITLGLPREPSDAGDPNIYMAISFYMSMTAVVFACVFSQDSLRRLIIMRRAYFIAAFVVSLIGIAGYFGQLPFATLYGRAIGTFKDPNVFGPFLILPLVMLVLTILGPAVRLRHLVLFSVIAFALLLSFSRGAWIHFIISAGIAVALTFLTAPDLRTRLRLIVLSAAAAGAFVVFVVSAISVGSLGEMLEQRAKLTQNYDVGSGGRFSLQELAVGAVLKHPAGMGPFEFARVYGGQQHNVYFQAFLDYGWMGGFAYVTLVILTLAIGFRQSIVPTPWQPYLIASLGMFCGEVLEGFVIDTDHWRHYFLALGLVWGLAVATMNDTRAQKRSSRALA